MRAVTMAPSPWHDRGWRDQVVAWIHERLRHHDATMTGPMTPRLRPWSVILRLSTDLGTVWFKANPPGSAYEPRLLAALHRWAPGRVLEPLAVDARRGWCLQPDGGMTLARLLDHDPGPRAWEKPLRQYAAMQRTLETRQVDLADLGVPELGPLALPMRYEQLLAHPTVSSRLVEPATYQTLRQLRGSIVDWSARLAGLGVPLSIDHADLSETNVFCHGEGYVFHNWGDASVGHPFTSLLVTLRAAASRFGLAADSPELRRLRDAYLEPWTSDYDRSTLHEATSLAQRLAPVSRALSWGKVFPVARTDAHLRDELATRIAGWLSQLLQAPPL